MLPLTKRQREILDYLNDFIQQHGYAPSLEEIGRRFSLSSLATVHKHLTNLEEKGFIKRAWNRSRSVELIPARLGSRAVERNPGGAGRSRRQARVLCAQSTR
jgi:repressor LexA